MALGSLGTVEIDWEAVRHDGARLTKAGVDPAHASEPLVGVREMRITGPHGACAVLVKPDETVRVFTRRARKAVLGAAGAEVVAEFSAMVVEIGMPGGRFARLYVNGDVVFSTDDLYPG